MLFVNGCGLVGQIGMISVKSLSSSIANMGNLGNLKWLQNSSIFFSKMFFVFRAVITEEFKVPDKMVGFSKYPRGALSPWFLPVLSIPLSRSQCVTCSQRLSHTVP